MVCWMTIVAWRVVWLKVWRGLAHSDGRVLTAHCLARKHLAQFPLVGNECCSKSRWEGSILNPVQLGLAIFYDIYLCVASSELTAEPAMPYLSKCSLNSCHTTTQTSSIATPLVLKLNTYTEQRKSASSDLGLFAAACSVAVSCVRRYSCQNEARHIGRRHYCALLLVIKLHALCLFIIHSCERMSPKNFHISLPLHLCRPLQSRSPSCRDCRGAERLPKTTRTRGKCLRSERRTPPHMAWPRSARPLARPLLV